jgi:hypothetical protein
MAFLSGGCPPFLLVHIVNWVPTLQASFGVLDWEQVVVSRMGVAHGTRFATQTLRSRSAALEECCARGVVLGFTMLLGLKPGHACGPTTCLSDASYVLTVVAANSA